MTKLLVTTLLATLAVGCGGTATQTEIVETNIAAEIEASQSAELATPTTPGTITRGDLDEVLARGPAPILGMVITEPYRERGRFVGFRIVEFTQGQPTAVDLRAGDVILAINGHRIERPEHYFEVFEALKTADRIVLRLKRDGRDETLTYPIVP